MITKYKIIEELAKNRTVETIIQNITKSEDDTQRFKPNAL